MELLLTAHRYWPSLGGTEKAAEDLARALVARGHAVTVATSDEPERPMDETRGGVRIRRFAMRKRVGFRVPPPDYRRFVLDARWDGVNLIGQRIWSTDFLYPHMRKFRRKPLFTAHGLYQWHMERTPVVDPLYYRVVLPRALRRAIAVADTTPEAEELRGLGAPDVRLVPLGIDAAELKDLPAGFRARYQLPLDEPILLYVGGFYPNKRVDRLVHAAAASGALLVVVGKDADPARGRAYCEALAQSTGARVRFLGPIPRADILSAYRESTLFVLASDFEGFGLALLEAMAAGLPFVSTPAGVAPDLASHGAGRVAPPERLAEEVRALLADPAERAAMGARGRAAVSRYAWDEVARKYEALFEEAARR